MYWFAKQPVRVTVWTDDRHQSPAAYFHIANGDLAIIYTEYHSRVDKQRYEPGRWKSRIVAIFLLFLTLLHVLT